MDFPPSNHSINVNHSAITDLVFKSFKGDCPLRAKLSEVIILSKTIHDHKKKKHKIHATLYFFLQLFL